MELEDFEHNAENIIEFRDLNIFIESKTDTRLGVNFWAGKCIPMQNTPDFHIWLYENIDDDGNFFIVNAGFNEKFFENGARLIFCPNITSCGNVELYPSSFEYREISYINSNFTDFKEILCQRKFQCCLCGNNVFNITYYSKKIK